MLGKIFGIDFQRKRLLKQVPNGPLHEFLEQPFPSRKKDYRDVEYVALDLETTGLDPRKDHILSVGFVILRGTSIKLSTAEHILVRTSRDIPEESAVIHQITDEQAAKGLDISQVMPHVLKVMQGRVMIAHHARIEAGFLSTACEGLYKGKILIPTVDTQTVALRLFHRRNIAFAPKELRLHSLRERYNLPRYPAHNALSDAISAAEVFIAQAAYRDRGEGMSLGEYLLQP